MNKLSVLRPDPASPTPLYLQIANKLTMAIQAGYWLANQPLPSERALVEAFGISRVTARKALEVLEQEGRIQRRPGSGSYITPRLEQPLARFTHLSEMIKQRGFKPGSRWLSREIAFANAEEMQHLHLPHNSRVSRLLRARTADDVVIGIERTALPHELVPDPEAVGASLYDYLRTTGFGVARATQHIGAASVTGELASLVDLPPGAAVLHLTRIGYLDNGVAVELTHSWFRSDYFTLVAELKM